MKQEEKQLLLKDLCARLPHKQKVCYKIHNNSEEITETLSGCILDYFKTGKIAVVKPYLRLMSSMTEDEAREITKLSGILTGSENILSISVKEEFIDIKIDDGVCSTETRTLWFTEMPTSITQLDCLNAHHFDYRGLIEKGLALEAPEGMYEHKSE